jgi:CobQ-like glutamine amidotransferase family enzyme
VGAESTVVIAELYPDLLGTYGDAGNAAVLRRRLEWRGLECRVLTIRGNAAVPASCDLYLLGGGEDAGQRLACERIARNTALADALARGVPVLAVCAGMQILGRSFVGAAGALVPGVGLLDLTTAPRATRAVGELLVDPHPQLLDAPLSGFENHLGSTALGPAARPLGSVRRGIGNGAGLDGAVHGHLIGTYLHGPVLARNPQLADLLLTWAIGQPLPALPLPSVDALRSARLSGRRLRCPRWVEPPYPDAERAFIPQPTRDLT